MYFNNNKVRNSHEAACAPNVFMPDKQLVRFHSFKYQKYSITF